MAEISHENLKQEIHAVLKTADLNVMSAKKIREQVEKALGCSLLNRKKECDDIVMDYMNNQEDEENQNDKSDESEEESESEAESEKEKKPAKAKKKTPAKGRETMQRSCSAKKKKYRSKGSDSDSDSDKPKSKKAKKAASGGAKRSTGFTRELKLSPDLATLVGAEALSRHEVVKRVWALIKERQLADPNNKQFTICDDQLYTVMKVKRFRTFGMLKHLKPHFID